MPSVTKMEEWSSTIKSVTSGESLAFLLNVLLVADILLTNFGYKPLFKIVTWSEAVRLSTPAHAMIFLVVFGITYLIARIISLPLLFFARPSNSDGFTPGYKIMSKAVKDNNEVLLKVLEQYRARRSRDFDLFYHLVVMSLLVAVELLTQKGSLIYLLGNRHTLYCLLILVVIVIVVKPKKETFWGDYQIPIEDGLTNGNGHRTELATDATSPWRLGKEHQEQPAEQVVSVAAPTIQDNRTNKQDGILPPTV